jgi:sugar O-acyltransferase (sialic acid O-acetyltransferase NeuD family)
MKMVLLGSGGHAKACKDVAIRAGWSVEGVVSPNEVSWADCPWLGTDLWLNSDEADSRYNYLVGVGQLVSSETRKRLYELLLRKGLPIATLIGRSAIVASSAHIESGTVAMEHSFVGPESRVGRNCIINTGAIIEHEAKIGDHCHISTGARVNGGCFIGEGSMVGSGAVVIQNVNVCADAMIGAGAVVIADIRASGTWVGVPARRIV